MNTILLQPTDVLFFRDGRPMDGSHSGHGAAWPLPTVISTAFHAALHRADLEKYTGQKIRRHRSGRSGNYGNERDRKFGCLRTVGPFPVCAKGDASTWFFPRPADAQLLLSTNPSFLPLRTDRAASPSSLPPELIYPVADTEEASKNTPQSWWSEGAWNTYLETVQRNELAARHFFKNDSDFADTEHTFGIGIDPNTGAQDGERFYSASYLRLREGWRLGAFATAPDRDFNDSEHGNDLISSLINGDSGEIVIGGQQRVCSAKREGKKGGRLPLPLGKCKDFSVSKGKHLVKWVLLSPAIWPEIPSGMSKRGTKSQSHPGGWLPNWILPSTGQVLLQSVSPQERRRRRSLNYDGKGYRSDENATAISARLVAAIVPKPIVVTGWALPNETDRPQGGAKSTHLAVPAGAVYYFETDSSEAAVALANALNWHGATNGTEIQNCRSTLLGEKGFGLGVCGTWQFYDRNVQ
jgi:hypothetical protein